MFHSTQLSVCYANGLCREDCDTPGRNCDMAHLLLASRKVVTQVLNSADAQRCSVDRTR